MMPPSDVVFGWHSYMSSYDSIRCGGSLGNYISHILVASVAIKIDRD